MQLFFYAGFSPALEVQKNVNFLHFIKVLTIHKRTLTRYIISKVFLYDRSGCYDKEYSCLTNNYHHTKACDNYYTKLYITDLIKIYLNIKETYMPDIYTTVRYTISYTQPQKDMAGNIKATWQRIVSTCADKSLISNNGLQCHSTPLHSERGFNWNTAHAGPIQQWCPHGGHQWLCDQQCLQIRSLKQLDSL